MKIFLSIVLTIALVSSAEARLGETPSQLETRFGKGDDLANCPNPGPYSGLHMQSFEKQEIHIEVTLTDISVGETYTSLHSDFEDVQIQALLAANSEGHQWTEQSGLGQVRRTWFRDDGAQAQLTGRRYLMVQSKLLVDKESKWGQAQKPNIEGF
jgi:hypothetical protein